MQSRRTQRAIRVAALAAAAGVSFTLYAQTLGIRPGLYEFTSSSDVQLPPDVAAKLPPQALERMRKPHVAQHCITQTDIEHVSQEISQGKQEQGCHVAEHSISGNQVRFTQQCGANVGHFEGTFASESFEGTMRSTNDRGNQLTVKIAARRIGDCSK